VAAGKCVVGVKPGSKKEFDSLNISARPWTESQLGPSPPDSCKDRPSGFGKNVGHGLTCPPAKVLAQAINLLKKALTCGENSI
jgi:hypothetical protein